ncbi:MAG: GDP-mannose 4,6-dehydratase [Acidimicrobiales bacterium]
MLVVQLRRVRPGTRDGTGPLTEEAPLRPVTPYAASKAAAEQVALQAHLGWGVAVIRVRPFNHLGPGQDDRFVAGALAAGWWRPRPAG